MTVMGIDIGGSHISACIVDLGLRKAATETFVREHIDPMGTAEETIDGWAHAVERAFAAGLTDANRNVDSVGVWREREDWRIGIAMPGPFDYEKGISLIRGLHKFESLYGLNIKELLAGRLGVSPAQIRFVNDASAYLLGEMMGGAGQGYARSAGLTLGTGLGSAAYRDGAILEGDLWCTPFRESRAEDYLCSRWFLQQYKAWGMGKNEIHGVKDMVALYPLSPAIRDIFHRFGRHLAEIVLMKYPPAVQDVVVIGGNIAGAWDLFIPAALDYCREQEVSINFLPAMLGENAAIMGGAFLFADHPRNSEK